MKILDRWTDTETTSDEVHYRLVEDHPGATPRLEICLYDEEVEDVGGSPAHPEDPDAAWKVAEELGDDFEALERRCAELARQRDEPKETPTP